MTNGATAYNVNASLMRSGIVSGIVRDAATNQPIKQVCVQVQRASDGAFLAHSARNASNRLRSADLTAMAPGRQR